jgi:hypothetical protein
MVPDRSRTHMWFICNAVGSQQHGQNTTNKDEVVVCETATNQLWHARARLVVQSGLHVHVHVH